MFLYTAIFFLSLGGMAVIMLRNREEFKAFNFAVFMEGVRREWTVIWREHFREKTFFALEKFLRLLRIWFLRMENMILKIIHRLRGIKDRNFTE